MPRLVFDIESINAEIARCEKLAKENSELLAKSLKEGRGLTTYLVNDYTEFSARVEVLKEIKAMFDKHDGDKKVIAKHTLRKLSFSLAAIGSVNMNELKAWASLSVDFDLADF